MNFANYSSQAPATGKTIPFVFRGLRNPDGTHPTLHVEFLGEANRPFWMDVLSRSTTRTHSSSGASSAAEIDRMTRETRDQQREDVIKYSARGIEHVFFADGTAATSKDIAGFVRAIPDVDFDALWAFTNSPANFRPYRIAEPADSLAEK